MPTIQRQRTIDAPPDVVWDVLTDHELYAEAAPNLRTVEVIDGAADTMVRRCVDQNDNTWTESCTWWEPETGFGVSVDVAESGFHRRLFTRFEGEWSLEETPDGTEVTIRFDFTPRYGPLGRLIGAYLVWKAPGLIERIFDHWETASQALVATDERDRDRAVSEPPAPTTNALYP